MVPPPGLCLVFKKVTAGRVAFGAIVTACPNKHAKTLYAILPSHSWVHNTGNASDKATLKSRPRDRVRGACDGHNLDSRHFRPSSLAQIEAIA